jgi:hypothetical protein
MENREYWLRINIQCWFNKKSMERCLIKDLYQ